METRVLRVGYYWPTLRADCPEYVKKCIQCQKHNNLIHQPVNEFHILTSQLPFVMWGINILGPFPLAREQHIFLY